MASSISGLPEVSFCETDTSAVERNVLATYEAVAETSLAPGDPVRLFLESLAYVIGQQRFLIDHAAKQNLLAYAGGGYLDHLGAWTDTRRLPAQAARTTLRFTAALPVPVAVPIPAGTRMSPDGALMFMTTEAVEIAPGQTSADAPALCAEKGAEGNGYQPGQVSRLVDPLPFVTEAANTTLTLGGTDAETDAAYRERVQLSPEKLSVAGPDGAYRFWALSAHQDIGDVCVRSPEPGKVEVRPLCRGGLLPGAEILAAVEDVFTDRKVRPLTDSVTVLAPEAVAYDLTVTWFLDGGNAAMAAAVQERVTKAVQDFLQWQRSKIGRDVNPSELVRRLMDAGAKRAEVTAPAFTPVEAWQVAQEGAVTVNYGGLEDG